jgi:hypothetical protein
MAEAYAPMRCTIEGWTSLTGMRPSVTRERILAGELPAVSAGAHILICVPEALEWLRRQSRTTASPPTSIAEGAVEARTMRLSLRRARAGLWTRQRE